MHTKSADQPIGKVLATEKNPTTIDKFCFWTSSDTKLNAFDIIKVDHLDGSHTYGSIENISHISDASSFMTNFISSDFGDVDANPPTFRVSMNYVEAKVTYNNKNIYTPVLNNSKVFLADEEEIAFALGLANVSNPLVCGALKMYEDTPYEKTLPVNLNAAFLVGPEGAHLNISGISGLAAKTSYAMFLMKAIQERYENNEDTDDSVAFVIFNVKGRDLLAIDKENDFSGDEEQKEKVHKQYEAIGLSGKPFSKVKYFVPYFRSTSSRRSTYMSQNDMEAETRNKSLLKYKYIYEYDKESIEMMFSNIDDPTQTMESIISKIIDPDDKDFGKLDTWNECMEKVSELSQKGSGGKSEISVLSWRKFMRIFRKAISDDMFANRVDIQNSECRLGEVLKTISKNDVFVIDIAKLPDDKQAFVFGDTMRTLYNVKLGDYDGEDKVAPPSRIIVFIDELNNYASKDIPKSSPILRQLLEVTERGRSLGIILFGAEQFRSNIEPRITGNCSTQAYGRTNSIETSTKDYSNLPATFKNMLLRLEQGDYLIQNPIFRSLLKIHFPLPVYKQFK